MFRALLCPSSGARDYDVGYHIDLSFCKDGEGSVTVNLWFLVVCVWCDVLCQFVVAGNRCIADFHTLENKRICMVIHPVVWSLHRLSYRKQSRVLSRTEILFFFLSHLAYVCSNPSSHSGNYTAISILPVFFQQNSAFSPKQCIDTFRTMLTINSVYSPNIVSRLVFELQPLLTVNRKPNFITLSYTLNEGITMRL